MATVYHSNHSGAASCLIIELYDIKALWVAQRTWMRSCAQAKPYLVSCISKRLNNGLFRSSKAEQIE